MKEGRVSIANIVKEILDQPGRLLGRVVKGGGWRLEVGEGGRDGKALRVRFCDKTCDNVTRVLTDAHSRTRSLKPPHETRLGCTWTSQGKSG